MRKNSFFRSEIGERKLRISNGYFQGLVHVNFATFSVFLCRRWSTTIFGFRGATKFPKRQKNLCFHPFELRNNEQGELEHWSCLNGRISLLIWSVFLTSFAVLGSVFFGGKYWRFRSNSLANAGKPRSNPAANPRSSVQTRTIAL